MLWIVILINTEIVVNNACLLNVTFIFLLYSYNMNYSFDWPIQGADRSLTLKLNRSVGEGHIGLSPWNQIFQEKKKSIFWKTFWLQESISMAIHFLDLWNYSLARPLKKKVFMCDNDEMQIEIWPFPTYRFNKTKFLALEL